MSLAPGDIVAKAVVERDDVLGRYWIKADGMSGRLDHRHIPPGLRLERGQTLENLVRLPVNDAFALVNYESNLIRYFYDRGGKLSDTANPKEVWIARWRDVASNPYAVVLSQCAPDELSAPTPYKLQKWYMARTNRWLMPVTSSDFFDGYGTEKRFCPSALMRTETSNYVVPACYKIGPPKTGLPFSYGGRLALENYSFRQKVRIYFHGFLHPPEWHYGVWKHMLSGTPSAANNQEKELWQELEIPLPDSREVNNIYGGCVEQNGEECCRCTSLAQFEKVHQKIDRLLKIYWANLVTFWESAATKRAEINSLAPHDGISELKIITFPEKPVLIRRKRVYPCLVLAGWIYDGVLDNLDRVAHVRVLTFFLKDNNRQKCPGAGWQRGKLENVTRM